MLFEVADLAKSRRHYRAEVSLLIDTALGVFGSAMKWHLLVIVCGFALYVSQNWGELAPVLDVEFGVVPDFSGVIEPLKWIVGLSAAVVYPARMWLSWVFHKRRAKRVFQERVLKGEAVIEPKEYLRLVKKSGDRLIWLTPHTAQPLETAKVGTLITGTTGAGKSTLFDQGIEQFFDYEIPLLIFDSGCTKVDKFYRPGIDVIINPFDERSVYPTLQGMSYTGMGVYSLPRALFPEGVNHLEAFFNGSAREVFGDCMKYLYLEGLDISYENMLDILSEPPIEIRRNLEKIDAQSVKFYSATGGSNQDQGTESTLVKYTAGLKHLVAIQDKPEFSLYEWIFGAGEKGNVFLTVQDGYMNEVRNLFSLIISSYAQLMMHRPEGVGQYYGLMMDEFDDLQALDAVITLLTKGRKRGNITWAGLQGISQMTAKYGIYKRDTMLGCFNTEIAFRPGNDAMAEGISKRLGEKETTKKAVTLNNPEGDAKDRPMSENYADHERKQPTVSAGALLRLPNYQCYIKQPGFPVVLDSTTLKPTGNTVPVSPFMANKALFYNTKARTKNIQQPSIQLNKTLKEKSER